jgi:hypothetical protein
VFNFLAKIQNVITVLSTISFQYADLLLPHRIIHGTSKINVNDCLVAEHILNNTERHTCDHKT